MNDVDRLNNSLQYNDNHISQVKKSSKQTMNKSKARIHMLDDTEEYIDLHVCRNIIEYKRKKFDFSRKMIRVKCYILVYVI